ncbi:MAG: PBSX family phage terminase large subunit [Lachnospiraceae bacterium]|nr:PBSX family phage terminase large subunit [Lachnospiraceae bacterium]
MILTQTIPWSDFSDKHKHYINTALKNRICVAEGAIRSGKTIDHCIIAAAHLELCRDKIHLASGSTIGNAKLNIGVCNGFGLEALFRGRCKWGKYRDNEALFLYTQTGEKVVVFAGGGKADSYKRILGNSYGLWIATEINEHYDSDDSRESFIKVAFGRQAAALDPLVLWDLNPCNPNHGIYQDYIDKYRDDKLPGYLYEHFTIDDNLSISDGRREEIKAQYDPSSVWYRRDILGERCVADGLVYPMFSRERHILKAPVETEGDYYVSSDYGIQNPNVFLLWRRERGSKRMICLKEDYYSGRDERHQLTDSQLVDRLDVMLGGITVKRVIIDPSAASMKAELRRRGYHTQDANNTVLDGISDVCSLLGADNLAFMPCCKNTIAEFGSYLWDTKAVDAGLDVPLKENDHCLTGDTLVDTVRGPVRLDALVGKRGRVYCTDGARQKTGVFHDVRMTQKEAEVFEVALADGRSVKATADHPILTRRGWVPVRDLRTDDEIACIGEVENA